LNLGVHGLTVEIDQVEHELISTFGLDVPGFESVGWEVVQVLGDDELRVGLDRGGEDMTVICRIRRSRRLLG
jgi:hypothetical protein